MLQPPPQALPEVRALPPMQSLRRRTTRLKTWIGQRMFRLGGPEPGEVFLNQRRVFILPTAAGLGFGVMLALLFIGSINYNLNLGFALTFTIAACAVIDMHLTFRNLAHLHLAAGRTAAVFCGDTAQFALRLINRRKHDRYAIWIDCVDPVQPNVSHPYDVAALATTQATISVTSNRRGWLAAPRVRLATRFPLGLLRAWCYWQPDAMVLVYPYPEPFAPPLPLAQHATAQGSGAAGQEDFAGIRAYQLGDSMRHLAWRQIARLDLAQGGHLVTKHFEGGANGELVLDFAVLPVRMDLELKLSRMTRWVLDAEARMLPYAFRLGTVDLAPACGPAHQALCLDALAQYPA